MSLAPSDTLDLFRTAWIHLRDEKYYSKSLVVHHGNTFYSLVKL